MGKMDPCPGCGSELVPTLAPLHGWRCPKCRFIWLAKPKEELNAEGLRALLGFAEDFIEHEGERAAKAEEENKSLREALMKQVEYGVQAVAKVSELEAYIKKTQPMLDAYLAPGMSWDGKWVNERAEKAEKEVAALRELREGDFQLVRNFAEDLEIPFVSRPKLPGNEWEQFHSGVWAMKSKIEELEAQLAIQAKEKP